MPKSNHDLALPRLTLADLAAAAEPHFEAVEITQGVFGQVPDNDSQARVGVFRRRGASAGAEAETARA